MPNLVGLRDTLPLLSMEDQAKQDTLVAMQLEALGLHRRDFLSTTDFRENKLSYVPTVQLESQRLVNKSSIGEGEKAKLEGWNNAWTRLQDDGTDSQNLRIVNEGLGQTHRRKLMSDDSVQEYTGEANFPGGGRGGRGDRGGGNAGRFTGRGGGGKAKGERRVTFQNVPLVQPITRVRVPKRHHPTAQADVPGRQPGPILKSVSAAKPAKRNINMLSMSSASIRRPVRYDGMLAAPSTFMASVNIREEQSRDEPKIKVAPSAPDTSKEESTEQNVGTTTTSTSSVKAMAHDSHASAIDVPTVKTTTAANESAVSVGARPKADLMDLDISQETTQPVLQFTAPSMKKQPSHRVVETSFSFDEQIEALEKSGVLNATQLGVLKTIQTQVHARENATSPVTEAPRQGTYTKSELLSLRPALAAPKVTTGIARKFADQRKAFLIGEHVHKTRYHTAASLTEDFEKLSISDKKPAKSAAITLSTTEKSRVNPFGPPPAKGKGPSLPVHLLNQTSTADHGAAVRGQYSSGNDILAPISNRLSPRNVIATTRPTRQNMINQTGFIALAENRLSAGKKEEDPLFIARERGL